MMRRVLPWVRTVVVGFLRNNCSMHAAGLTYFAMLALMPVLCLLLFFAKTCDVDQYARQEINGRIDAMIANIEHGQDDDMALLAAPNAEEREKKRIAALEFGKQARQIANGLFDRVEKFDVGTLGWVGFGFLVWTVISSLGMVEASFNHIWGVEKPRPVWKRAYLYLFISIVLPVLAAIAASLPVLRVVKNVIVMTMGSVWLTKWVSEGLVWFLDSWLFRTAFSLAFASIAFALFFQMMPNCRVRFRPAFWGGLITALLFGGWMKLCAVAQVGIAKSSALYGSFAFLPIVLAWMYMSWEVILLGANMTYAFQTHGITGGERRRSASCAVVKGRLV